MAAEAAWPRPILLIITKIFIRGYIEIIKYELNQMKRNLIIY